MKKFLKETMALLLVFGMIFSKPLSAYSAVVPDKGYLAAETLSEEADIALSEEKGKSYGRLLENDEDVKASKNAEEEESLSEELPARYDLRDLGYSTSVKNQNPWGTCWIFGTLASAESNAIKNGIAKSDVDYAERHLAYYVYNNYYIEGDKRQGINDPLGNTEGDYAVYEYESKNLYDAGGSEVRALFYLLGWRGPANENDFPYTAKEAPAVNMDNIYNKSLAHLQNFGRINVKSQPLQVKKALMAHGALTVSYSDDDNYYCDKGQYYCTDNINSGHHTVALIGWDDNYAFGKNKKGEQPERNGAWIIKNSWGTEIGCLDEGYMYISYEDVTLREAYYQEYEKTDNYDNNYFYSGGVIDKSFNGANTYANVYEIKKGNELLKACGIAVNDTDVNYELQIYKNPKDPTDPESGEKMLADPIKGKTTFEGFYTVPLTHPLLLSKGDKAAVVFYLYKGDALRSGEEIKVFVDSSDDVDLTEDKPQYYTKEERNQSFCSKKEKNSDGIYEGKWNDLIDEAPYPLTARIHAYTVNTSWGIDFRELNNSTISLGVGESYQLKLAEGSTSSFTDLTLNTNNASIVEISEEGKLTAKGAGLALITVTDKNDKSKYQYVYVLVESVFSDIKVSFKDKNTSYPYTGKAIEPEVIVTLGEKQLVKDEDYTVSYENNTAVGSITESPSSYPCVIVSGIGTYKDSGLKRVPFTIEKKNLNSAEFRLTSEYTKIYYSGKENKPYVSIDWNGTILKNGRDYDVSYINNIEISTGSEAKPAVIVTGRGNYEGTLTLEFVIEKRPFDLWVDGSQDNKLYNVNYTYCADEIKPDNLNVYWYEQKLTEGKDYTIKYDNNIDAYDISKSNANDTEAPAIIITGKGNYAVCKSRILFNIKPATLDESFADKTILAFRKGKVQKGKTRVSYISADKDIIRLKENKDYKLEYDKAYAVDKDGNKIEDFKGVLLSDIGSYRIPIKGIGNFSNDGGESFFEETIQDKKEALSLFNISKAVFKIGDKVNPDITKSWQMDKKYIDLSSESYKLIYTIDGKEKELKEYKPGEDLKNCDYVVSYKNNDGAGKATVIFNGINNFTGKLTKTFTIEKAKLSSGQDKAGGTYSIYGLEGSCKYVKNGVTPKIDLIYTLNNSGVSLKEGKDYTVKYINYKECFDKKTLSQNSASAPAVIVTGKGNYSGTLKAAYAITKSSIFDLGGYSYATDIKYTGRPFKNMSKPAIYIYDDNGERLKAGTDYEKEPSYFYEESVEVTSKTDKAKISRAAGDKIEDTDIIPAGAKLIAMVEGKNNYTGTEKGFISTVIIPFSCYDPKNDISKSAVSLNDKGKDTVNRNIGRSFTLDEDEIDVKYNKAILDKDGSCYECASVINDSGDGKVTIIIKGRGIYGGVEKLNIDARAGKVK
ncbi:MAG: hypothetical protein K5931_10665 [Lachnospiraceae bacterium]|nr:hypothetical protein [Lachnospiraceae bacterium]